MHLVMGLGNPGRAYKRSRHNLGFLVLDQVAENHQIAVSREGFSSLWGKGAIAGQPVILAKPLTFMNRSGEAVAALTAYFKVSLEQLVVIHDDLDLAFGQIKIVPGGGAGGHRGVRSIQQVLGSSHFARVKLGIGRPRFGETVEDYVLRPWYEDQLEQVQQMVEAGAAAVSAIFSEGLEKAMAKVNASSVPGER